MGSRMEALPSSMATPTSNSACMSKNTCSNSPPLSSFLRSGPLRSSHPPCRKYSTFPANGSHSMCGRALFGHYQFHGTGYSSTCHPDNWVTKLLQDSLSGGEGSQAMKVSTESKRKSPASALADCPSPLHQFPSMLGIVGVTHRMTLPTFCVHSSSLKASPFVLEVTPNPKKESVFDSSEKGDVSSAVSTVSCNEQEAEVIVDTVQHATAAEACESNCLPSDDLLGSCNETASLAAKDGGSNGSASDVVEYVGPSPGACVVDTSDIEEVATVCDLNTSMGDADDELDDGQCSSDEYESCTDSDDDDDDDDDDNSEYDPVEFECESETGATRDRSCLPCVEISPPKDSNDTDLSRGHCQSLRKLLSEESGYCEGASSEEGGKAEGGGCCWFRLSETLGEDEVDWDASDDSGSEVNFNEDLLRSFEVLSPQVFCLTPPGNACLAPRASTSSSSLPMPTPTCATHFIRAENRDMRVSACDRSPQRVTKHEQSAKNECGLSECVVPDTEFADRCDDKHDGEASGGSHQQPESSSSSSSPRKDSTQHTKSVRFAEGSDFAMVHRICAWSFAYREARKGPWEQYARDRVHFRRRVENVASVLEPCLAARRAAVKGHFANCVKS